MVRFPRFRPTILTVMLLAAVWLSSACSSRLNTFEARSDSAKQILDLYVLVIIVSSVVGAAVLLAMLWLMIKYRARPGGVAKQIHGNTKLEVTWTIAPILLILTIAIPTMFWIAGTAEDPDDDALQVTAIGHQWWFEFQYPGLGPDGGDLVTANELHVPIGRDIVVTLESDDVIHSFWVPKLVGKTDMIPGRINTLETFKPTDIGLYYGQCVEFCGSAHALMQFRVHVDSQGDFDRWTAGFSAGPKASEAGTPAARGEVLFATCAACHSIQGTTAAGAIGPDLTLFGERTTVGAGILDNTDENLRAWIKDVRALKPIPKEGLFMPTFADALSDDDIAAIAAYLNNQTLD